MAFDEYEPKIKALISAMAAGASLLTLASVYGDDILPVTPVARAGAIFATECLIFFLSVSLGFAALAFSVVIWQGKRDGFPYFWSRSFIVSAILAFIVSAFSMLFIGYYQVMDKEVLGPPNQEQAASAASGGNDLLAKWIQIVPAATVGTVPPSYPYGRVVRAVIPAAGSCSKVSLRVGDNKSASMTERPNPHAVAYPVKVCEAALEPATSGLVIFPDGSMLTLPPGKNLLGARAGIAVLADSGCRGRVRQPCNSGTWPFVRVAKAAADLLPDLAIHLGDSFYRKNFTEVGEDNWERWRREFFEPATPLLESAPLLMVRGNHESCLDAGGRGWFYFFDWHDAGNALACPADGTRRFTHPYALDITENKFRLIVVDTANTWLGPKDKFKEENEKQYQSQFQSTVPKLAESSSEAWLLTHVPLRAVQNTDNRKHGFIHDATKHLRDLTAEPKLDSPISKVLSGDLHLFQSIEVDSQAIQLIIGTGGVNLDEEPDIPSPKEVNGEIWKWTTVHSHGFLWASREKPTDGWKTEFFEVESVKSPTATWPK